MRPFLALGCVLFTCLAATARCEIIVLVDHIDNDAAMEEFNFPRISPPATNGPVRQAKFTLVDGKIDDNSGGLEKLHDGLLPNGEDQPDRNFFFAAGTSGGKIQIDLGSATPIWQINSYSWHPGNRAPQVYKVYGAPKDLQVTNRDWKLIADVDTHSKYGTAGGQYAVSIRESAGKIGDFRYLRFDCSSTESDDDFGNTFYSEIDVLDHPEVGRSRAKGPVEEPYVARSRDGRYEIAIDFNRAPDLKEWAETNLAPVLVDWYPKIVDFLPSAGYIAPQRIKVIIRPGRGVADTTGTHVNAYVPWVRQEAKGEAVGALVHEMVHVVQQYGEARHNPEAKHNPGWLVEGVADYFRWYHYEPQSHGADINPRNVARAHYDNSYRVTANFLNWASQKHDKDLVPQLNALMREGNYDENFWTKHTGKSIRQLGEEWKASLKSTTTPPPS